jgi:hypothetical protein
MVFFLFFSKDQTNYYARFIISGVFFCWFRVSCVSSKITTTIEHYPQILFWWNSVFFVGGSCKIGMKKEKLKKLFPGKNQI